MRINEFYDWFFFRFFITKKLAGGTLLINPYSHGNIRRKTRVNKNIKITKNIEKYVKDYTKQYSTMSLIKYQRTTIFFFEL